MEEIDVETLRVGERVTFDDPVIQTFKRTVDRIFNFLYFFVGCDPSLFTQCHEHDDAREVMLKFFASRNRQELALLAFEIAIFIDTLKNDFYDKSVGKPMLYITDFFLNFRDKMNFYCLFKMNKTHYLYTSEFRFYMRRNSAFY